MIARMRSPQSERGAISVLVIGLFLALMVMAGLVVDGGNAINARARATDDAEQAARAGANQINEDLLRSSGQVQIEQGAAYNAAVAYLTGPQVGYSAGEIQVVPAADEVTVTVSTTEPTDLLSLIGIGSFDVSGTASARPAPGIVQEFP